MRKDDTIQFRVSSAEKADLAERAKSEGVSLSDFIRQRIGLDQPTQVPRSTSIADQVLGTPEPSSERRRMLEDLLPPR